MSKKEILKSNRANRRKPETMSLSSKPSVSTPGILVFPSLNPIYYSKTREFVSCDSAKKKHMTEGRKRGPPKLKAPLPDEEEEEVELVEGPTLESQFAAFAKYGDVESPGTHITLTQMDNWLKTAGIIQVRKLTRTDTGVCYFHFKKYKLDFEDFNEFIELLASRKKISAESIREKLIKCGLPNPEEEKKIVR